jgi:hypothetical protein
MLTVEEQRSEIATKRLETLKWIVSTSGDLDSVRHLIHSTNENKSFSGVQSLNAELGEAIEIMRKDFIQFREDIFLALATDDGHLVSSLPKLEFMKQVYGSTENVQKNELKLIAARFDDGNGSVNVPEFLDFFGTPHTLRTAKSAANAVRMSLDMLSLNGSAYLNTYPGKESAVDMRRSHLTKGLDRSAKKLLALWLFVREELMRSLDVLKESKNGKTKKDSKSKPEEENVVKVAILKRSLMEICGKNALFMLSLSSNVQMCEELYTAALKTIKHKYSGKKKMKENEKENEKSDENNSDTEKIENDGTDNGTQDYVKDEDDQLEVPSFPEDRIEAEDTMMLAKRFELAGVMHIDGFVSFFDEAFLRSHAISIRGLPVSYESAITGISPFRWSTEWTDLKQTSILRQSTQNLLSPPSSTEPKSSQPGEKKQEEKKLKDKKPANETKPTSPVVSQGCGCLGSKPPAFDTVEVKKKPIDPPNPMPHREKKSVDENPTAKEEDKESVDEEKRQETLQKSQEKNVRDAPVPTLKHSEEFQTPPKSRTSGNLNDGFLPDRDCLGQDDDKRRVGLNADLDGVPTPIGAQATAPSSGGPRRRLRRREDRNFSHEKNTSSFGGDSDDELGDGAVLFNAPRSRGGR